MFICNVLSFLVMNMEHNRRFSTCTFMSVIAVNDNIILLLGVYKWMMITFQNMIPTNLVCKLFMYFIHITWALSSYSIVFMTFDRATAVIVPHRAASLCTTKRARITSVVLFVVVSTFLFLCLCLLTSVR